MRLDLNGAYKRAESSDKLDALKPGLTDYRRRQLDSIGELRRDHAPFLGLRCRKPSALTIARLKMSNIAATKNEHSWKSLETAAQEFPAPIGRLLGLKLTSVSIGQATVEFEATECHANPMGTLHGGVLCDIADAAMGAAYGSTLADGETFTTVELKINFLRPVWKAKLRARAGMVRIGKVVGFVECDIFDEQERLVARASSTCMTLRGRLAERRQPRRNQLNELMFGQPTENREREWEWRGSQHLPEQIDADERLPGYLREPHLPPFESRRARVFASSAFLKRDRS